MRIGQAAELVGVSTRTIRHYHRVGVLPEPERDPNGYRRYSLEDVIRLTRARRLTDLGLSLDVVGEVLAASGSADLTEILDELDADLDRQDAAIARQRARLTQLRLRLDEQGDPLQSSAAAQLAELLKDTGVVGPAADLDVDLMSLLPEEAAAYIFQIDQTRGLTPERQSHLKDVYRRFDSIAGLDPDDPLVDVLADDIVAGLPDELKQEASRPLPAGVDELWQMSAPPLGEMITEHLAPAQVAVVTAIMSRLVSS
ncbi:MerR family transcriptional regulator [Gordonia sp. (in: high G+C Gram-positive bacteria)]|jgi:DNA-binding transcriptional MerR regulator|uniref:helix-turn-helix domain-containing protein n=1 Tax=Gordonia sp. (in: high G+C Gram-positive bacteria) TaxID=84139 RepID=UPI001D6084FA|nr:MerR family transcriptional regulator [Gordonia sp. (in: high G+C Gram-positive bacteria)]MCB1297274.1 MerR family transcriptional regulator [Gordonia sp. (in: high G+C Gram-positive bacteria)]HMS77066.1 MerR family transcriptional regulator [Gordonia sp. (in: high G+C Gram-positive bacteria)]HQV16968.1 MerR family transcriptional regulator [Gordonia sp. (in: high G+C Gram-positive bacteria)]